MTAPALRVVAVCDELPPVNTRVVGFVSAEHTRGVADILYRADAGWVDDDGYVIPDADNRVTHYIVLAPPEPAEVARVRETVAAWAAENVTVVEGVAARAPQAESPCVCGHAAHPGGACTAERGDRQVAEVGPVAMGPCVCAAYEPDDDTATTDWGGGR